MVDTVDLESILLLGKGSSPFFDKVIKNKIINLLVLKMDYIKNFVTLNVKKKTGKKKETVVSINVLKKEIENEFIKKKFKFLHYLISFVITTFFFKTLHLQPLTSEDILKLSTSLDLYTSIKTELQYLTFYRDVFFDS